MDTLEEFKANIKFEEEVNFLGKTLKMDTRSFEQLIRDVTRNNVMRLFLLRCNFQIMFLPEGVPPPVGLEPAETELRLPRRDA